MGVAPPKKIRNKIIVYVSFKRKAWALGGREGLVAENPKTQLLKNKKGSIPPIDPLSLTLFSLNFLNLPQGEPYTAAKRNFQESAQAQDTINSIWVKTDKEWVAGELLIRGKVYAYFNR